MITRKLYLYFPKSETEKPIVCQLVRDYNLTVNIFRAKVTPEEEGYLVLDATGEPEDIDAALSFLKTFNVDVDNVNKGLRWHADRCTHCGNCVPHCPTHALDFADRSTREVRFFEGQCVECLACVRNCPFAACTSMI